MAFPPGVETVTLTAGASGYRALDGEPYAGTLRFTPSVSRVVSAEHGVIALGAVNATLGASGMFTEMLLATDADGFSPTGWTYRVDEELTNAPGRAYSISLPAAAPNVALPSLSPVESTTGTVSSPAVLSVNGETGIVVINAADVGADPAGTASTAIAAHSADTTDVHGISDTTLLETTAGAASKVSTHAAVTVSVHGIADTSILETQPGAASKVSVHTAAADPHGDRAYANTTFATTGTVSALNVFVDDALVRVAAIENGTAFLAGVNSSDNVLVSGADLTVKDNDKGYRLRRGGAALDLEATGADLVISNWSGTGFNGTQRNYLRLSADAQNIQIAGKVEYVDALYGATRHVLDGAANTAGFFGATPVGRPAVAGSWADGSAGASLAAALATLGLIADNTSA
ncbi:hypothetical protein [Streptomyces sp. NPDC050704]|uniref:hypothetical protein n=1 Tax=Streptomyces sp. NPDC050704 TaxID=3157219 RepID=UPI00342DD249